jgi:hypothetical protein
LAKVNQINKTVSIESVEEIKRECKGKEGRQHAQGKRGLPFSPGIKKENFVDNPCLAKIFAENGCKIFSWPDPQNYAM